MSVQGNLLLPLSLRAGANLQSGDGAGAQYKAIDINGTIAANNSAAFGLLQNKPRSGEDATVGVLGHLKGVGGTALTAGARVKVTTSGYLIVVASGDGSCGKVVTACASGAAVEVLVDFISAATTY